MAVDIVTLGQSVLFKAKFTNDDGTPFIATSQATWQIRDFDGNLVSQGVGAQSVPSPEEWSVNITIPSSAPVSPNDKRYSIIWVVRNNTNTSRYTESFSVRSSVDFDFVELDRLAIEKSPLIDSIALDTTSNLTSATVRLLLETGEEIFNSGLVNVGPQLSAAIVTASHKVSTYTSPAGIDRMTPDTSTFRPFVIEWAHNGYGGLEKEFHFLYVVNYRTMVLVSQLRRMIDKAKRAHPNPYLNFTDVDLVAYLDQGLQYVNFCKPSLTVFTINTIPNVLDVGLLHAAAYCALSAQYLAEGQAAFSFSGQAVSLEIDRTQFLDSAISRILQFLETQLPTAKRMWLRSTGGTGQSGGVLGVNIGPSIGWSGLGWRQDRHRRILMGF